MGFLGSSQVMQMAAAARLVADDQLPPGTPSAVVSLGCAAERRGVSCRRSGRQIQAPQTSTRSSGGPGSCSDAAVPVSAADAALALTLAHLKQATAARSGCKKAVDAGVGHPAAPRAGLDLKSTAEMAWSVYSRCVEVSPAGCSGLHAATPWENTKQGHAEKWFPRVQICKQAARLGSSREDCALAHLF